MDAATAAIVVYDGVDGLDAVGPHRVLAGGADRGGPDPAFRTVGDADAVETAQGLRVGVDGPLTDRPDLLLVPGGGWNARADRGAWREAQRGAVPEAVADCHRRGATVASVCTGAMLLEAAGLLEGRPATTHRGAREDLAAAGVDVRDARLVDDGDVLTAAGVTAGIDLGFHLLERACGAEVAADVAAGMEYERRGPVHRT